MKPIIYPSSNPLIHLLHMTIIYNQTKETRLICNDFFQSQTFLDDQTAILPDLPPSVTCTQLSNIVLLPLEVESVLKTLTIGKASGPNELSNRIL